MAWVQKYQILTRDRHNILWTTKIYEDGFSGDITNLIGSGIDPLKFEFINESDDIFDVFKSSRVILTVWSYTMFALADLYSYEDMFHKVEIYQGANLYFSGYVDPHQHTEPYGPVPYPVNIYCIDGLTLLKNILYEESEGVPYNGHILESQIILDILGKIGFTTFKEYVNLYEDAMDKEADDSPMDQLQIDTDLFQDMYCDEVLKEILKKYNANIRQIDGVFSIFRPKELIGEVVYGRIFTAATTKSATSITPKQYINRSSYASALLQVSGSVVTIQDPAKKIISNLNYGNKESWLDNWEFKGKTYNEDTGTWDNWTNMNGVIGFNSINDILPGEADGCILPTSTSSRDYFIFQSFGGYLKQTNKLIYFSFDYLFYNFSGGNLNGVDLWVVLITADGAYKLWFYDQTSFGWTTDPNYPYITFETNGIVPGSSGWTHFELKLESLPADGPYIIQLCNSVGETALYTAFKNIRFGSTADSIITKKKKIIGWKFPWKVAYKLGFAKSTYKVVSEVIEIVSKEYIKENSINGKVDERDFILGDVIEPDIENIVEQFAGALMLAEARTRRDSVLLIGAPIGYSEMLITCNGVGRYAVWNTSLTQTAADFVVAYAALYLASGVALTSLGTYIRFTGTVSGYEFYGKTTVSYHLGNLQGIIIKSYP
ncbi:MAG TPA: hypothetical protein VMV77_07145, partial [Bacteroidales bacterium]|nr:hypothetical protein [Bacteroidales bacterium]